MRPGPPPTPCRARAASSIQLAVASPPASELKENRAIPARKVRRRPSRSPDAGPEQEQAAEGEDVGVEDPRQRGAREAEAALDVGQGDVDDGGVEHHHQLGGEDDGQHDGGMAAPPARSPGGDLRLGPLTTAFPLVS